MLFRSEALLEGQEFFPRVAQFVHAIPLPLYDFRGRATGEALVGEFLVESAKLLVDLPDFLVQARQFGGEVHRAGKVHDHLATLRHMAGRRLGGRAVAIHDKLAKPGQGDHDFPVAFQQRGLFGRTGEIRTEENRQLVGRRDVQFRPDCADRADLKR